MKRSLLLAVTTVLFAASGPPWGFFAHQRINRLAVFTLPPEMIGFYKKNLAYITEASVAPDKRRYSVPEEGARHYLDVDHYGDSALDLLPRRWQDAVKTLPPDTLQQNGVLPWHIYRMYVRLLDAFLLGDPALILKVSAELGHYISDAHVPLHTTANYNGQLTGQEGIHAFWESRLPELFSSEYDFVVGRAQYLADPQGAAWEMVRSSHALVGEVLQEESKLALQSGERKYSFETRGATTVRVYANEYALAYHRALDGMVERRMRESIKAIGDFWFTAWVNAGQPDLRHFIHYTPTAEELRRTRVELDVLKAANKNVRPHEE